MAVLHGAVCAAYSNTSRNVSRACFGEIWKSVCVTEHWQTLWHYFGKHYQNSTYEELVELPSSFRTYPTCAHGKDAGLSFCRGVKLWLRGAASFVQSGYWQGPANTITLQEVLDGAALTRRDCPWFHVVVRALLQRFPQIFPAKTRAEALPLGFLRGSPYEEIRRYLLQNPLKQLLKGSTFPFPGMRLLSEASFSQELIRRKTPGGLDGCILSRFHPSPCRASSNLFRSFYQNRYPGLPSKYIEELKLSPDALVAASGFLAASDRLRNLGEDYLSSLASAESALVAALTALPSLEVSLTNHSLATFTPTHIIWQLLDKLSLETEVHLFVDPPSSTASKPVLNGVFMSLVPDRDIVADDIRRTHTFHCPRIFRETFETAVKFADQEHVRLVEVGGYLGDCVLWATAWRGPSRVRALEVEPVVAATARLTESIARNNFSEAISVVTTALGDGLACVPRVEFGSEASVLDNPNFSPIVCHPDGPDVKEGANGKSCTDATSCDRLETLDNVLDAWTSLDIGDYVDLIRIKAAGMEYLILRGLWRHLIAKRICRVMIRLSSTMLEKVRRLLQWLSVYELTSAMLVSSDYHDGSPADSQFDVTLTCIECTRK